MFDQKKLESNGSTWAQMRHKALELLGLEDTGQSSKELADRLRMAMTDERVFSMQDDTVFISQAEVKDAQIELPIHQGTLTQSGIEIRMTVGDGALREMNDEEKARLVKAIQRCVLDTIESSPILHLQRGKEYRSDPQPDGDVKLSRFSLPRMEVAGAREQFVSQVLNRELPLAPMTANGKPPLNILPREIDDSK